MTLQPEPAHQQYTLPPCLSGHKKTDIFAPFYPFAKTVYDCKNKDVIGSGFPLS